MDDRALVVCLYGDFSATKSLRNHHKKYTRIDAKSFLGAGVLAG